MLKALELVGFKSFADKTRFEFPPGITAVVGPNGSGKSNVVDAVKWVLGEQSVKSLRGKEMADVIFNGSSGRPPLNFAEATLTFDNASRVLPLDAPDVHITRRVYRSGESEYLINRQPSRLRDIRDLFAGTGAGSEAYCIIEQGKVDILLQSSPRDRRAIFEEAAGISRFKAKKVESLRRLERVEQNLLRLADIVSEVENQLRSVKAQAAKAQRYREYTGRLQDLRTQVALADWRQLSERIDAMETELAELHREVTESSATAETIEVQSLAAETQASELTEAIRVCEAKIAENRERIAACESRSEHERALVAELEVEASRLRKQLATMGLSIGDLQQQAESIAADVTLAAAQRDDVRQQLAAQEAAFAALAADLEARRATMSERRQAYLQALRAAAALGNEMSVLESQLATAREAAARFTTRLAELAAAQQSQQQQLDALQQGSATLVAGIEVAADALTTTQSQIAAARTRLAGRTKDLHHARQQLSAAQARAAVLDELEQRLEGLGAGVKEILLAARSAEPGPWSQIVGLVADLIRVKVELAPVIEVALGERAQHLVVADGAELWDQLAAGQQNFHGRVGFLPASGASPETAADLLTGRPGVVGRADTFVEVAPQWQPLLTRLLGSTWIVDTLAHAWPLRNEIPDGGQLVTLAGDLLAPNGTLVVGSWLASPGLISRRSELRVLRDQIAALELQAAELEHDSGMLERQIGEAELLAATQANEHRAAVDRLAEQRLQIAAAQQRHAELADQTRAAQSDLDAAERQAAVAQAALVKTRELREAGERQVAELDALLAQLTQELDAIDADRGRRNAEMTAIKVQLAKVEDRLENLQTQQRHLEHSQEERRQAREETAARLAAAEQRARQSRAAILQASATIAELFLSKDAFAAEAAAHVEARESLRVERGELAQQAQRVRARIKRLEDQVHSKDLAANEVRLQRNTLAAQLREDYGIELSELEAATTDEEQRARAEVDQEIAELRRKINNLGNVNLDALDELDALEARYQALAAQYQDLAEAKTALERIIHKINNDSRRLFAETLEIVRGHFQTLFRKLFGGGHADIILEEGVDILDSGIEIVARPPGKEPRNISLLSGGEKTLTCVALLLAIFRSRPSPFCVLDEVDAALDEANIERFIGVLKEFLAWTQFIIVTHSKKTMTCATTLYGVTMQESGISKRVSVHFDDISENGEFRWSPQREAAREDDTAAA
ncbi:MAG: chromosome segregation protein SMC [Pirellulales bacterium]|nr:chromosome segregation protein SMC [Pirellulales bacterium]